ncbi:unnamed protein product [Didymodactylos carnosus]|uniref:Uncharacterized protein n=1 Tax=Didymodactylos carnosus TaxID=1234261 RepID=A0A8S2EXR1_9BILA|nr:unnamed protein product [Didymodactylos carnosus]CAF4073782.1 unnamed protein product [Didymodactylos carnosus]
MYEDVHGVVDNLYYDRLLNKTFGIDSRDEAQWSSIVEPIWTTVTLQGKKAAVLFWAHSSTTFHGVLPLIYTWSYTDKISLREKINNALTYFREISDMDLVMIYHPCDNSSTQMTKYTNVTILCFSKLLSLDTDIQYLLDKVKQDMHDDLNIILLSDHGMANVKRTIKPFYEKYIDKSMIDDYYTTGATFNVNPKPDKTEEVLAGLRGIPNVTVFTRETMPERFHYSKQLYRLGEIFVIPNEDGIIFSGDTTNSSSSWNGGTHGWDNDFPSMKAIFMAKGPYFKRGFELDTLNNVDIYRMACKILNLEPNIYATDGSLHNVTKMFSRTSSFNNQYSILYLCLILFLLYLHY